jgi:hypothetical protein
MKLLLPRAWIKLPASATIRHKLDERCNRDDIHSFQECGIMTAVKEAEYNPEDCASTLHAVRVVLKVPSGHSIVQHAVELVENMQSHAATIDDIFDSKRHAAPEMQSFWDNELDEALQNLVAFLRGQNASHG